MSISIRTITPEQLPEWVSAMSRASGHYETEESIELNRSYTELDRTFAAFDSDQIVGTTTTRTAGMTIPRGVSSLGYVDEVGVLPTHRRQGILTRMMHAQLEQMRERGEPLAALSASESLIYERFGFGIATWGEWWKIERHHTALKTRPDPSGRCRFVDDETALELWVDLHRRVAETRVGMVRYDTSYWRVALWDAEFQRRGASRNFHVAYLRGDDVAGMVCYRIRNDVVLVMSLLSLDDEAELELWRYCFGIDLMTHTEAFAQPLDSALPWALVDPRRLERSVRDHVWLRLVDVEAALRSRSYSRPGRLSIGVRDSTCAWNQGVYVLEANAEGGSDCVRTNKPADIEMTAADLASVYLGGISFATLSRAGRIEARDPKSIGLADDMFRTERAPWSLEM